jgi:hypothetical protein
MLYPTLDVMTLFQINPKRRETPQRSKIGCGAGKAIADQKRMTEALRTGPPRPS